MKKPPTTMTNGQKGRKSSQKTFMINSTPHASFDLPLNSTLRAAKVFPCVFTGKAIAVRVCV
jgi:hypothetical protein